MEHDVPSTLSKKLRQQINVEEYNLIRINEKETAWGIINRTTQKPSGVQNNQIIFGND